jgi:hypothetical protein
MLMFLNGGFYQKQAFDFTDFAEKPATQTLGRVRRVPMDRFQRLRIFG